MNIKKKTTDRGRPFDPNAKREAIFLRIRSEDRERIVQLAESRGVGVATVARGLILDGLDREGV